MHAYFVEKVRYAEVKTTYLHLMYGSNDMSTIRELYELSITLYDLHLLVLGLLRCHLQCHIFQLVY